MRTTVDIKAGLLLQLKKRARREGLSFRELLNQVIHRGLAASTPRPATPYGTPVFDMGGYRFNVDKALTLAGDLEDEEILRKVSLGK